MNQLYPIIRRARRPLYPPEEASGGNRSVCERSTLTPSPSPQGEGGTSAIAVESTPLVSPVEVVVVETSPVVADSQSLSLQGENQSLFTSAATKGRKGKPVAAKSPKQTVNETPGAQP
jgi:hypothetical protein